LPILFSLWDESFCFHCNENTMLFSSSLKPKCWGVGPSLFFLHYNESLSLCAQTLTEDWSFKCGQTWLYLCLYVALLNTPKIMSVFTADRTQVLPSLAVDLTAVQHIWTPRLRGVIKSPGSLLPVGYKAVSCHKTTSAMVSHSQWNTSYCNIILFPLKFWSSAKSLRKSFWIAMAYCSYWGKPEQAPGSIKRIYSLNYVEHVYCTLQQVSETFLRHWLVNLV